MTMRARATWHVTVDADRCEGHGLCLMLAPDVFDITDDEIATCDPLQIETHWDAIRAAAAACPRQAIAATATNTPTTGEGD
jgi:ferredoxin